MTTLPAQKTATNIEDMLEQQVDYREARVVDLGITSVLIRSNVPNFSGYRYFSRSHEPRPGEHAPYELYCIDLNHGHSLDVRGYGKPCRIRTRLDSYGS